uniref:Uncharacterized protein n=1 Tax=Arundo donax TaxID=35708 RepID=A0A0A9G0X8_ARUDO
MSAAMFNQIYVFCFTTSFCLELSMIWSSLSGRALIASAASFACSAASNLVLSIP